MALCGGRHQIAGCQNGYARAGDKLATVAGSGLAGRCGAGGDGQSGAGNVACRKPRGYRLPIGFAVGALFDFLSGDVSRAPSWVRSVRLEWVYRLLREPGRLWRRYLVGNPIFLLRVLNQWLSGARV